MAVKQGISPLSLTLFTGVEKAALCNHRYQLFLGAKMFSFMALIGAMRQPVKVEYSVDEEGDAEIKSVTGDNDVDVFKYLSEDTCEDLLIECYVHYKKYCDAKNADAAIRRW